MLIGVKKKSSAKVSIGSFAATVCASTRLFTALGPPKVKVKAKQTYFAAVNLQIKV